MVLNRVVVRAVVSRGGTRAVEVAATGPAATASNGTQHRGGVTSRLVGVVPPNGGGAVLARVIVTTTVAAAREGNGAVVARLGVSPAPVRVVLLGAVTARVRTRVGKDR